MNPRDPLNFFSPYERQPAGHENQLTRALLLVLRMSPLAHIEWLRLVDGVRTLSTMPAASFDTQKHAIRAVDEDVDKAELISVFLAPERPMVAGGDVQESDRGQVLDAIIDYGGEVIVVIENKVFEADDEQARNINLHGAGVQIVDGQPVVVVLWREFIEALMALRERGLVAGTEAAVVDDFLTYTEDHFPDLGPYRSLALCSRAPARIQRRLRQVLGDAVNGEAVASQYGPYVPTPGGTAVAANVYLTLANHHLDEHVVATGGAIELGLYPADTLTQAQAFYGDPSAIQGLRQLVTEHGWDAGPNFHFGHMARGFCWTNSSIELDAYLDLWQEHIHDTGQMPRDEWDATWSWLLEEKIASPEDRPEFDRHFTNSRRKTATPRPGLWLARRWPLVEAETLDTQGVLADHVRTALDHALTALGQPQIAS